VSVALATVAKTCVGNRSTSIPRKRRFFMWCYICIYSPGSKLGMEIGGKDRDWLVSLARDYGWDPQVPEGDYYTAAQVMLFASHEDEDPGKVSAQDALTLAAALERALVEYRPSPEGDLEPTEYWAEDWQDLVKDLVEIAKAGPFAVIVGTY
jgi:hypothetical protein